MKTNSIFLTLYMCLVTSWSVARQQYCGCYSEENVQDDYLYQTGRVSVAYGTVNVPLTHGTEIKPEAGTNIVFKFNETPNVRSSCRKTVSIEIYDEKERRYIHSQQSDDRMEFNYTFPLSDRTYTVKLMVTAASTATTDVNLHNNANRDCPKRVAVFVIPKPTKIILNKNILNPAKN